MVGSELTHSEKLSTEQPRNKRSKAAIECANSFGYLTDNEIDILMKVAFLLTDTPTIVNVGAGAGTSGLALREAQPDAVLFTVDVNEGGPLGGLEGERNAFKKWPGLKPPIQILGKSHDVARNWKYGKIDMVFIDDGHSKRDIIGDIIYWRPHVKVGGYIAIDDYGSEKWPMVKIVTDRLLVNPRNQLVAMVDSVVVFKVVE